MNKWDMIYRSDKYSFNLTSFFSKSITSLFFILLLVILNMFFYSFITITLYKFICYDSLTVFFYNNNYIDKVINIFYYYKIHHTIYIIDSMIYNSISVTNNTLSYFIFYHKINHSYELEMYFFFIKDRFYNMKLDLPYNLVFLSFYLRTSNFNWINTISLQKTLIINISETGLFFFRVYNPSHITIKLISIYMVYPNILTYYVNKLQCFCFNTMFLYGLELIDLPVILFIQPFFSTRSIVFFNNIILYYVIFLN